jgi:hypothetical protein
MPVTAMSARNVIVAPKSLANSNCYRFFANVQMREARHERARVKLVYIFLKQPNPNHLSIHMQELFVADGSSRI